MRRIKLADNPGAAVDLFGSGNDGYIENSPPTASTTVKALAMNIFQEELVRAVVNHGQTLDQATTNIATHNKEQLWRAILGMGFGGNSVVFHTADSGVGATEEIVDGIDAFVFAPLAGNKIVGAIQVPDKYVVGSAMNLTWGWWANATSNNVDWDVQVQLVRVGTDAVASPGATNSPSVAAVTLDSPSGKYRETSAALINSSGQVNATAVAAGDLLIVTITRNAGDSATVNAMIARDSFQPKLI